MGAPTSSITDNPNSAVWAKAVVLSNTPDTIAARGYYVGTGGDVYVLMGDGTTVTFSSVPGGTILPVRGMGCGTSTTASNIVAMY